uniref:Putative secreted protein n=1 Tax=Anopheles triannulatus TaxID=58253 RepID=A0A2M4B3W1_9DIPT
MVWWWWWWWSWWSRHGWWWSRGPRCQAGDLPVDATDLTQLVLLEHLQWDLGRGRSRPPLRSPLRQQPLQHLVHLVRLARVQPERLAVHAARSRQLDAKTGAGHLLSL